MDDNALLRPLNREDTGLIITTAKETLQYSIEGAGSVCFFIRVRSDDKVNNWYPIF